MELAISSNPDPTSASAAAGVSIGVLSVEAAAMASDSFLCDELEFEVRTTVEDTKVLIGCKATKL